MAGQPAGLITPELDGDHEDANQLTEQYVPSAINMVLTNPVQSYEQPANQLTEQYVPSAINMVLTNPVQSYQQFMDSFLYLKTDNVPGFIPAIENHPEENLFERNVNERREVKRLKTTREAVQNGKTVEQHEFEEEKDDLETEELDEGDDSLVSPRQRLPHQKYVKVDNFLDAMSSDDDDSDNLSFEDISDLLLDSGGSSTLLLDAKKVSIGMMKELADVQSADRDAMSNLPSHLPGESDLTEAIAQTNVEIGETRLLVGNSNRDPAIQAEELQSDEVQPFALDPDFDYDNVKLTPKWDYNPLCSPEPS